MADQINCPEDIRILVVEDSPTQAIELQETLERRGCRVTVAHNANQALSAARTHKPTIVISDIIMPGMDGYELCRQVKSDPDLHDIPVILLTALSDPQDVIKGLESGADNFFIKSQDKRLLLSTIQYILTNKALRKQVSPEASVDIIFFGRRYTITASRMQIIDLLLSTFEGAIQKNAELERANERLLETQGELISVNYQLREEIAERKRVEEERERLIVKLESALAEVKTLSGLLPICASCKKVRDDQGYWHQVESYIQDHSTAEISHGICPECAQRLYPNYFEATPQEGE